ncbi:MAG: carbohydrate deacetylase [Chthoniobacterales bacterium]
MKEENGARFLIVNADDFGLTSGVNRGIIEAHEKGIVTSASLMVRHPAAQEAADYARAHPELSVGLHFDLAEWRFRDRQWDLAYRVIESSDASAIREEFQRQLQQFQNLLARWPSHLDSHQHVHLLDPVRSILGESAAHLGVPLRSCSAAISYCGSFYGQTDRGGFYPEGISLAAFIRTVQSLPPGWTELGCHPGYRIGLDSVYAAEREEEMRVLRCAELRPVLSAAGVSLRTFHDLKIETLT